MVIVRDVHRMCQLERVYALIEGGTHARKINKARKRQGVLEVRTATQDIWMSSVVSIEFRKKELDYTPYVLLKISANPLRHNNLTLMGGFKQVDRKRSLLCRRSLTVDKHLCCRGIAINGLWLRYFPITSDVQISPLPASICSSLYHTGTSKKRRKREHSVSTI